MQREIIQNEIKRLKGGSRITSQEGGGETNQKILLAKR
jgi:hypothetical protein